MIARDDHRVTVGQSGGLELILHDVVLSVQREVGEISGDDEDVRAFGNGGPEEMPERFHSVGLASGKYQVGVSKTPFGQEPGR